MPYHIRTRPVPWNVLQEVSKKLLGKRGQPFRTKLPAHGAAPTSPPLFEKLRSRKYANIHHLSPSSSSEGLIHILCPYLHHIFNKNFPHIHSRSSASGLWAGHTSKNNSSGLRRRKVLGRVGGKKNISNPIKRFDGFMLFTSYLGV